MTENHGVASSILALGTPLSCERPPAQPPKLALLIILGDLVGIVFLMSVKPSFSGSIVAILVSIGLGAALALLPVGRAVLAAVDSFAKVEESNPFYR